MKVLATVLVLVTGVAGCGGAGSGEQPAPAAGEESTRPVAPAPWSAEPLARASVPAPYMEAWRSAENRSSCALLAVAPEAAAHALEGTAGAGSTPRPRTARFGGGWGVAYDLPGTRSAFGVAGTGVEPGPDTYDDWPHHRKWRDGSRAGYGPEGGDGPKQLAYLQVVGQSCLYNVWSRLGREHLERLLEGLRFVSGTQ